MRTGRTTRFRSRRSILTSAGAITSQPARCGGTFHGSTTEQLAFDIPVPGPSLIAAPDDADTVAGMRREPSIAERRLAEVGDILSRVIDFHHAFDLPREPLPTAQVGDSLGQLRVRLLREEVEEFAEAVQSRDLVAIADALADVVYVAYGSAVTYGIDLDAVLREVHRSNMSKLDSGGRPVMREDGKVLKSAWYRPPKISAVIEGQLPLFDIDASAPGAAFGPGGKVVAG